MEGLDWETFLGQVDLDDTDPQVLTTTEAFFVKANLKTPSAAAGVAFDKLAVHGLPRVFKVLHPGADGFPRMPSPGMRDCKC